MPLARQPRKRPFLSGVRIAAGPRPHHVGWRGPHLLHATLRPANLGVRRRRRPPRGVGMEPAAVRPATCSITRTPSALPACSGPGSESRHHRWAGRLVRAHRLVGPQPRRADAAAQGRPGRHPGPDLEHPAGCRRRAALEAPWLVGAQAGPAGGPRGRRAGHPLRAGGPGRAGEVPGGRAAAPPPGRGRPG